MSDGDDTDQNGEYKLELSGGQTTPIRDADGNPGFAVLTATLTKSNQPYGSQPLTFEILFKPHACHLDPSDSGNNFEYTTKTGPDGKAQVNVYSDVAQSLTVSANYAEGSHILSPENIIEFISPKADKLVAKLDPSTATMNHVIKVTASVTAQGTGVGNTTINMALPRVVGDNPNAAVFCTSDGEPFKDTYDCQVTSDSNGNATAYFTSPLWASGQITIEIDDPDHSVDKQKLNYVFAYDSDIEAIFNDTVVCELEPDPATEPTVNSGSGNNPQVTAVAPADGKSTLQINGRVQYKNQQKQLPANPKVTLRTDGAWAFFDAPGAGKSREITVACDDLNDVPGYFTAKLISNAPEIGKVSVTIDRDIDDRGNDLPQPAPEPVHALYEFCDAWSQVNNTKIQFTLGSSSDYSIYANGLHQAPVTLSFELFSINNTDSKDPLPQEGCPTVAEVAARVVFLEYVSGQPIYSLENGSSWPADRTWGFNATPNQYDRNSVDGGATMAILDTDRSTVDAGRATLYYYIRHRPANTHGSVQIGVDIAPTGQYLDKNANLQQAKQVRYSQIDKALGGPILTINALPPPQLGPDSLASTCDQLSYGRQNDDGPANNPANSEYNYNYFRQFNYSIRPSAAFKDKYKIRYVNFAATNPDNLGKSCCYSSHILGLYDYRLYLWPVNISGLEGKGDTTPTAGYMMQSDNLYYGATFQPEEPEDSVFYVTRYIGFGATYYNQYIQTDINLVMTDNYGNTYQVCLPAETTAPKYDPTTMKDWNPARPGAGSRNSSNTTDTSGAYTIGNAQNGMSIGQRSPVVDGPPASASDEELVYQFIAGKTGPLRMGILLSKLYGGGLSPNATCSPVFNMSFADDSMCQRSIIYDSANYQSKLICAPGAWSSSTTIRGVTLRPMWKTGGILLGVNPNLSKDSTGNVLYASISGNSGDQISVGAWSAGNDALVWKANPTE